jgi:hypothetical protein
MSYIITYGLLYAEVASFSAMKTVRCPKHIADGTTFLMRSMRVKYFLFNKWGRGDMKKISPSKYLSFEIPKKKIVFTIDYC